METSTDIVEGFPQGDMADKKPLFEEAESFPQEAEPVDIPIFDEPEGYPHRGKNKLLLHACCGPCSLEPVRILQERGWDITIFYANSNIAPVTEYNRRLNTLIAWAEAEGIPVIEGDYCPEYWKETVGAFASEHDQTIPENREKRCRMCYALRLYEAAEYAASHGFDALGTTLDVSPYQYTEAIGEVLELAVVETNVYRAFTEGYQAILPVFEDFTPYYHAATIRSRALGMYRQNYCGCALSYEEAERERAERKAARDAEKEARRAAREAKSAEAKAKAQEKLEERRAYDAKQRRKREVLKSMRLEQKASLASGIDETDGAGDNGAEVFVDADTRSDAIIDATTQGRDQT